MKHCNCTALLLALAICASWLPAPSHAESKRIVVYPLSQSYVDTRTGDSLSEIAARLLPDNPQLQQHLMADIFRLNPNAFIAHDPNRLLTNMRLWLPNQLNNAERANDSADYQVESFSWGSVRRLK
jgi:Tfp pilus assembly protein FimV